MNSRPKGTGRIFPRKGSAIWSCAYFLRGKEYRESTGETDPKKAEKYLNHRLKEVGADQIGAKAFVGPRQERMKISELLDALESDYKLRGKDSPQFHTHLKHLRTYFSRWRALEITSEAVDRYVEIRQKTGAANATINRSTQLLNQAFKLAVDRKHLSSTPQIRHLSEKGNARRGFFNDEDFSAVAAALPGYLSDFAGFGYLTGWRKGEIASLRWEDVDENVIRLRGQNAKNGEGRMVTLDGELAALIARRKTSRHVEIDGASMMGDLIFHNQGRPIGDIRKARASACVATGRGEFFCRKCNQPAKGARCNNCNSGARYSGRIFHDFRRTAVRNMVRAGVPERVAMTISGHKTRSIFDRYNIVNEDDLREAMKRTQAYLSAGTDRKGVPQLISAGHERRAQ